MLKEYFVNNEQQLCFVVKEGDVNDILLPLKYLAVIDYRRVIEMEEKGGELMKVMRNTHLDNGSNALVQFQELFVQFKRPMTAIKETTDTATDNGSDSKPTARRRRGRPAGSKNKT